MGFSQYFPALSNKMAWLRLFPLMNCHCLIKKINTFNGMDQIILKKAWSNQNFSTNDRFSWFFLVISNFPIFFWFLMMEDPQFLHPWRRRGGQKPALCMIPHKKYQFPREKKLIGIGGAPHTSTAVLKKHRVHDECTPLDYLRVAKFSTLKY